ncbi:hypothetical protein DCC81_20215 [Chitinophaga parva]|uniref:PKD domain-containing protein n=1 Tax=Chitinophaga parva TaxID=2169414 RepID=A0A2T7BCC9_9BACT|nr:PKD domain-containing protein [Chitinophaga parva]PUZ22756.1 hypothetical protein DCC81_20215 [Chitinophaga parva]
MKSFQYISRMSGLCLLAAALHACTPESSSQDLGPLPVASFTAAPLSGNANRIAIASTTPGAFMWQWQYGDAGGTSSKEKDTITFSKKGTYAIQLTAYTRGGAATAAQQVTIANDLPPVNVLKGSTMDADATQYWTVLNTGGTQTSISIANGVMNFSNTGNTNGAIYQAVQVDANRNYYFSGHVKGNGATNTWFEIYILPDVPVQGSDYGNGKKFVALNTWAGCGGAAFDGDIATIGCDGDYKGQNGKIKFATAGTIYIVIKAGSSGGTMGNGGINIDDVTFSEEQ